MSGVSRKGRSREAQLPAGHPRKKARTAEGELHDKTPEGSAEDTFKLQISESQGTLQSAATGQRRHALVSGLDDSPTESKIGFHKPPILLDTAAAADNVNKECLAPLNASTTSSSVKASITTSAPVVNTPSSVLLGSGRSPYFALTGPSFERMRLRGAHYVDKTGAIAELLQNDDFSHRSIFIRPRKFGKTLALDAMAMILAAGPLPTGMRSPPWADFKAIDVDAMFGGLQVYDRLKSGPLLGTVHYVITLDLGGMSTAKDLDSAIVARLATIARRSFGDKAYDLVASAGKDIIVALCHLVMLVPPEVPVALLVDEYDAPILADISEGRWAEANEGMAALNQVMGFTKQSFGQRVERCVFTGVARFTHTSFFADANNFVDITDKQITSRIVGFTAAEITSTFPNELKAFGERVLRDSSSGMSCTNAEYSLGISCPDAGSSLGISCMDAGSSLEISCTDAGSSLEISCMDAGLEELSRWYDGYCFDGKTSCFAPFPVLTALEAGRITIRELEASSSARWLNLSPDALFASLGSELIAAGSAETGDRLQLADLKRHKVSARQLLLQIGVLTLKPQLDSLEISSGVAPCVLPNEFARRSILNGIRQAIGDTSQCKIIQTIKSLLERKKFMEFTCVVKTLVAKFPRCILEESDQESALQGFLFAILWATVPPNIILKPEPEVVKGGPKLRLTFDGEDGVWII